MRSFLILLLFIKRTRAEKLELIDVDIISSQTKEGYFNENISFRWNNWINPVHNPSKVIDFAD
jgi:hypothetical protein